MKNLKLTMAASWALVVLAGAQVHGQAPLIASLSLNGDLVSTNLLPGTAGTVEWAPSVTGPWSESWTSLVEVIADFSGAFAVKVPMFYRVRFANPDPAKLAWIPPGTFTQGSPVNEMFHSVDEIQHETTISQGFWMGRFEVTQAEYQAVTGTNPSSFTGPSLPVDSITWSDATNYCAQLTEQERLAGRLPDGYVYRLPTESEWEYACRAGTTAAFYLGAALITDEANFYGLGEYVSSVGQLENPEGTYVGEPTEVGSYKPNPWGVYDLYGNAWEWCSDWLGDYPLEPVVDPVGPNMGTFRVLRGGAWLSDGSGCRSAYRSGRFPDVGDNYVGMRVVLARSLP